MATHGILPKRLEDYTFPICAAWLYGKEIKRPRNTKTTISINESTPVASVGDCVSVDVLVSITPGLIVQMSGFITRQSYQYACMFVDHNYDFTYVHILKSHTGYEAVESNESFEVYAKSNGFDIIHYHADNGIF